MKNIRSIAYRPQIDGLRTIAVLPVIFYHFSMFQSYSSGGFGGVDVFFVISGFLVNSIIISDIMKDKFSFAIFYERRVRRLFPAMFTLFTTLLIICYFIYYQQHLYQQLIQEIKYALFSIINCLFYYRSDITTNGYWGQQAKTWLLLHFWSLAVEQQFYMITPIILILVSKLKKNKGFLLFAILIYCLIITISFVLSVKYTQKIPMFAFYLIVCRAWQLGLGATLAIILHQSSIQTIKLKLNQYLNRDNIFQKEIFNRITLEILSWSGLGMILWSYYYFNDKNDHYPGYKALVPCFGTFLFIGATFVRYQTVQQQQYVRIVNFDANHQSLNNQNQQILQPSPIIQKQQQQEKQPQEKRIVLSSAYILSLKPMVWIGQISYSLYLWHWPIWLLNFQCFSPQNLEITTLNKCFLLVLTFLLAFFTTQFIENPVRDKKKVSTKLLWSLFAICWIGIMAYLFIASALQLGGIEQQPNQPNNQNFTKSKQNIFLYPIKDEEGTSILNPYMDYDLRLIELQTINKAPDTKLIQSFSASRMNDNAYHSYFVNMKEGSDNDIVENACIMSVGNSHTRQHSFSMQELAQQHNLSLMISVKSSIQVNNIHSAFHKWVLSQIQLYTPKVIFIQQYWRFYKRLKTQTTENSIINIIDPLLNVSNPPQLIVLFGDNPIVNVQVEPWVSQNSFPKQLKKTYFTQGKQSWSFLENIDTLNLKDQMQLEQQIHTIIKKNYDTDIVKFYPYLHQLMQNPYTGKVQLFGSQINGQYLFADNCHLSIKGAKRYKHYIKQKVFEKAQKLCKKVKKQN